MHFHWLNAEFLHDSHTHTTQCQPDKNDYLLFLSPQVHCSVDKAVWLVWSILYAWTMAFFFLFISLASSFACFARKTACDASCKPWFGSRFKHFLCFFSRHYLSVCVQCSLVWRREGYLDCCGNNATICGFRWLWFITKTIHFELFTMYLLGTIGETGPKIPFYSVRNLREKC